MAAVAVADLAFARSGDKGDASNVGVVARSEECYAVLKKYLTVERVKSHFREICRGAVERYELPNILALNFILHDSLGGGGSESLRTDAQGKTHGLAMLQIQLDLNDQELRAVSGVLKDDGSE